MIFIFHGLDFLPRKQFEQGQNYGREFFFKRDFSNIRFVCFSWDYNYTVGEIAGRRMDCNCGSSECRRRVL